MKRIGLLGGMSWESSREYYRLLNEGIRERLGGLHSSDLTMASVDFGPLSDAMDRQDWAYIQGVLVQRARSLVDAKAEIILICTNTMHKLAETIADAVAPVPLLHIGATAARAAREKGFEKVALLGTRFTMEEDFYRKHLESEGLEVLIPDTEKRRWIDELIFKELCVGIFNNQARRRMTEIVGDLKADGAEAAVLGCTELPLILSAEDSPLPLLDTMELHVNAALDKALAGT